MDGIFHWPRSGHHFLILLCLTLFIASSDAVGARSEEIDRVAVLVKTMVKQSLEQLDERSDQSKNIKKVKKYFQYLDRWVESGYRVRYLSERGSDYKECVYGLFKVAAFVERNQEPEIFLCQRAFDQKREDIAHILIHEMVHKIGYEIESKTEAPDECFADEISRISGVLSQKSDWESGYGFQCENRSDIKELGRYFPAADG